MELTKLKVFDLFAGGGGFSYGLHRTGGFETTLFCEINKYAQQVIAKNFPGIPIIDDVTKIDRETVEKYGRPDIITAGIPCQPFSSAGNQLGTQDERFLWGDLHRILQYASYPLLLLENVANLLRDDRGFTFAGILYDLAGLGYDAEWRVFRASEFGYPHKRERVYLLAYPSEKRCEWRIEQTGEIQTLLSQVEAHETLGGAEACRVGRDALHNPPLFSCHDGVSQRLYRNHTKMNQVMGNAIIPDIAEAIGKSILAIVVDVG